MHVHSRFLVPDTRFSGGMTEIERHTEGTDVTKCVITSQSFLALSGVGQPASEVLLDVDLAADPDDDGDERTVPC